MTMSTYKSLAGPAGGLIVTNEEKLAERLDAIAFPGMTANFDAAKSAALAITMLDWQVHGNAYAEKMVSVSKQLLNIWQHSAFRSSPAKTASPGLTQFAVEAARFGGGQAASKTLRKSGFLACGIGLPIDPVEGDLNGLRIGTPELVRWGVTERDAPQLADLIARALTTNDPASVAKEVADLRAQFSEIHFTL